MSDENRHDWKANSPRVKTHALTPNQKAAIADGKPFVGYVDFSKLSDEEKRLVYKHVTGEEMP